MTQQLHNLLSVADGALVRGDWHSAIAGYRSALKVSPRNADAWYNLGYALRAARDFAAALDAYQLAIDNGLRGAESAHVNRAAILSEHLGRSEDAEVELHRALALAPNFVPALANLGMLLEDRGARAEAREAYERLLAAAPGNANALLRLSMMDIHDGTAGDRIAQLRAALLRPGITLDERADIGFALANVLDAVGSHEDAWGALMAANEADRQATPPVRSYQPVAHEKLVTALMAMPPAPREPGRSSPARDSAPSPIFICGLFRSGSTLVEQILSRHPAITAAGELDFIPALIEREVQPYPTRLAAATDAELAGWRTKYLEDVRQLIGDAPTFTDKRCDNFLHIDLIKRLFPQAKIIHTVRQPDDVMVSTLFLRFGHAVPYGGSVEHFRHWHQQYHRLMLHWQTRFGQDIVDVDYDRLVADPKTEISALLDALGLDWSDACLGDNGSKAVRVQTASNWQVRQPIHRRSSGRFRHYASQLAAWPGA